MNPWVAKGIAKKKSQKCTPGNEKIYKNYSEKLLKLQGNAKKDMETHERNNTKS